MIDFSINVGFTPPETHEPFFAVAAEVSGPEIHENIVDLPISAFVYD